MRNETAENYPSMPTTAYSDIEQLAGQIAEAIFFLLSLARTSGYHLSHIKAGLCEGPLFCSKYIGGS
jgi:hypothetical protein